MKDEKEILALTGLRFIAALYVFLFHIHIRWPLSSNWFVSNVLNQGAIGMSIFFVLSGFVLTYRYRDGKTDARSYLLSRFARIYPVYVVAALVTLPWLGVSFTGDFWQGVAKAAFLVMANIFLVQAWLPQLFPIWNVGASWSISVEVFCYLLLPLMLPILSRLTWSERWIVAGACVVLAALPGLSAKLFDAPSIGVFYSLPIYRLPEFVLGCLVCLAWADGRGRHIGSWMQVGIVAAITLYLGFAGPFLPLYVGHNWIVIPVLAIVLLCLASGRGVLAAMLSTRLLVWLGKVSYSFYSFQTLLLLLLIGHHDELVGRIPALANHWALASVSFLVLIVVAAAGHYLIEEPARNWIKRRGHSAQTAM